MATIDLTGTGVAGGIPWAGMDDHFTMSAQYAIPSTAASGDVVQCMDVPAGVKVKSVSVKTVVAAAGTTFTANVGDGGDADGYDATIDLKAAANTWTHTAIGTDAYGASGNLYTAADTIDLTITTSAVTTFPTVLIVAECVKIY